MITGIIFDLGHTLIHLTRDINEVAREGAAAMAAWYFKKKRIKLDQPALIEVFLAERQMAWLNGDKTQTETPLVQSLATALDKIEAPPTAKTKSLLEAAVKIYFEPEQAAWAAYPDAVETLKRLKSEGYRLGLYSNADDDPFVQRLINNNKFRPELGVSFSSAGKGWRKPKPDGFELIAKRWNAPVEEIVVVGDTLRADVLGAQQAGMKSILVTMHESSSNDDHRHIQPTAVAQRLSDLPDIIRRL